MPRTPRTECRVYHFVCHFTHIRVPFIYAFCFAQAVREVRLMLRRFLRLCRSGKSDVY